MESGKAGTAGKSRKHLSFYEAMKLVETSTPVAASKSYAAAVNVSTTSIATQPDLTWPNAEDKFKKISDLEKQKRRLQKQQKIKIQSRHRCLWIHEIQAPVSQRQEKTQKIRKRIV